MNTYRYSQTWCCLLVMICASLLSGCGGGITTDSAMFNWDDSTSTPGLTKGGAVFFEFFLTDDKSEKFAVWSDRRFLSAETSTGALGTGLKASLETTGQPVSVIANGNDFKKGERIITIGNQIAVLGGSGVVLVSTQKENPELKIVQIPADSEFWKIFKSQDDDPPTQLSIFAKQNKEIEEFFKSHAPADNSI